MDIRIEKAGSLKAKPENENALGFGALFSDHMFIMEYDDGQGWHSARVQPYGPLSLEPSAMVLHYGQEIFEGLKAYRTDSGDVLLFRAKDNALRLNQSGERMCMPPVPPEDFVAAVTKLVDTERDWVPNSPGTSLYLRPTMIATEARLGVHPSHKYLFYIICSPSGAYYPKGLAPIRIYVEDTYVRATRGGTGYAKTGGNYAASLKAAEIAEKKGYEQILWLDGVERKYVEEVGSMNMMFVIGGKLVTAALEGTILPGITRDSVVKLAKKLGLPVEERKISIDELLEGSASGQLTEAFGTGTAAVVAPVGELTYKDQSVVINNGQIGPWTQKLYDELTGIQWGKRPDEQGWVTKV